MLPKLPVLFELLELCGGTQCVSCNPQRGEVVPVDESSLHSGVFPLYGTYGTYLTDAASSPRTRRCCARKSSWTKESGKASAFRQAILRIRDATRWRSADGGIFCPLDPRALLLRPHSADPWPSWCCSVARLRVLVILSAATRTYEQAAPSRPCSALAWSSPDARRAPPRGDDANMGRASSQTQRPGHHKNAPETDQGDADQRHDEHRVAGTHDRSVFAPVPGAGARADVDDVVGRLEGHPGAVGERHGCGVMNLRTRRRVDGWRQGRSHEHAVAAIAGRRPGTCHIDGAAPGAIDAPTKNERDAAQHFVPQARRQQRAVVNVRRR